MVREFSLTRMWALLSTAVVTALLVAMLMPITASAMSSSVLIKLTNQQRTQNGLPTLNYNAQLTASAMAKAKHMIANNYWAHNAPDGTSPWTFMQANDYSYTAAGENLAKGFVTDDSTINGWMSSAGHRANILNGRYLDIGIAVVSGVFQGVETNLVVAHYGASNSSAPASAPKPQPKPITQPQLALQPSVVTSQPVTEVVKSAEVPQPKKRTVEVIWQEIVIDVVKKALFIRPSWFEQQPVLHTAFVKI